MPIGALPRLSQQTTFATRLVGLVVDVLRAGAKSVAVGARYPRGMPHVRILEIGNAFSMFNLYIKLLGCPTFYPRLPPMGVSVKSPHQTKHAMLPFLVERHWHWWVKV